MDQQTEPVPLALDPADQLRLLTALTAPPRPSNRLRRAAARYRLWRKALRLFSS